MATFTERVLRAVSKIPRGKVLSYKEVARRAGKPRAYRVVGSVLNKNRNPVIPCHRVISADKNIGGYNRGVNEKVAKLLSEGCIGVLPTDTIYGLVGSALSREAVARIYRVRRRNPKKPFIILIASFGDLVRFGVAVSTKTRKMLHKLWPGKVSVILPCASKRFSYLHRGTKTVAFRLPAKAGLRALLRKTGPLVAPSANLEGWPPSRTVAEARKYFGRKVDFYLDSGRLFSRPSTLVALENGSFIVKRRGA